MQQNETHKKERKLRMIGIVLIILLVIASIVLAVILHHSWNAYTGDRERISRQLSELQNKHAALILKQEELEKQRANLEMTLQRPLLDQNLEPQLALKLQRLYLAIDKLPTNRKVVKNGTQPATNAVTKNKKAPTNFADRLLDQFASVVTVSKNDKNHNRSANNLELSKIQLKLTVNELRWSSMEHDKIAYQHGIDRAQEILQNFDPNDPQVQKVAKMLDDLEQNR